MNFRKLISKFMFLMVKMFLFVKELKAKVKKTKFLKNYKMLKKKVKKKF